MMEQRASTSGSTRHNDSIQFVYDQQQQSQQQQQRQSQQPRQLKNEDSRHTSSRRSHSRTAEYQGGTTTGQSHQQSSINPRLGGSRVTTTRSRSGGSRPAAEQLCSCNATQLQEELERLRESTTKALHQSWGEVETLNAKFTITQEEIAQLRVALDTSYKHEMKMERKFEKTKKLLLELKIKKEKEGKTKPQLFRRRHNTDQSEQTAPSSFPKSMSHTMLNKILDFSNHSNMALTPSLLRGGGNANESVATASITASGDEGSMATAFTTTGISSFGNLRGGKMVNNNSYNDNAEFYFSTSGHGYDQYSSRHGGGVEEGDQDDTIHEEGIYDDQDDAGTTNLSATEHSTISLAETVHILKDKLEVREQEITLLENVITENTKTFQELHLQHEEKELEKQKRRNKNRFERKDSKKSNREEKQQQQYQQQQQQQIYDGED